MITDIIHYQYSTLVPSESFCRTCRIIPRKIWYSLVGFFNSCRLDGFLVSDLILLIALTRIFLCFANILLLTIFNSPLPPLRWKLVRGVFAFTGFRAFRASLTPRVCHHFSPRCRSVWRYCIIFFENVCHLEGVSLDDFCKERVWPLFWRWLRH